jgi:hypothetical protein
MAAKAVAWALPELCELPLLPAAGVVVLTLPPPPPPQASRAALNAAMAKLAMSCRGSRALAGTGSRNWLWPAVIVFFMIPPCGMKVLFLKCASAKQHRAVHYELKITWSK